MPQKYCKRNSTVPRLRQAAAAMHRKKKERAGWGRSAAHRSWISVEEGYSSVSCIKAQGHNSRGQRQHALKHTLEMGQLN